MGTLLKSLPSFCWLNSIQVFGWFDAEVLAQGFIWWNQTQNCKAGKDALYHTTILAIITFNLFHPIDRYCNGTMIQSSRVKMKNRRSYCGLREVRINMQWVLVVVNVTIYTGRYLHFAMISLIIIKSVNTTNIIVITLKSSPTWNILQHLRPYILMKVNFMF